MTNPTTVIRLLLIALFLASAGCRSWVPKSAAPSAIQVTGECSDYAMQFRDAVRQADVINAQTPALTDLPFLHINRFMAALAKDVSSREQQRHWVEALAALGQQTRISENSNLPRPWPAAALKRLSDCAQDFASSPSFADARASLVTTVRANSPVQDAYIDPYRWLGLYAVMRPVYDLQIRRLQAQQKATFGKHPSVGVPRIFDLQAPRPKLPASVIAEWLAMAKAENKLGLPTPGDKQLEQLFFHHAPRIVVDYVDTQDAIATPFWRGDDLHFVKEAPIVYTLTSHARIADQNMLQLNYVFWFSERKPTTFPDFYAGKVDGLIWRVTLDHDGEVLLYDSIHNCGCYHKLFRISERLQARQDPLSNEPKTIYDATDLDPNLSVTLHLASNTHAIIGLDHATAVATQGYSLAPYQALTMLPSETGRRSLFDASGIMPGSQRLERYTLWPTGVEDVGAMRQWGTHAIGFIDKQHFDDPNLLDSYFHREH